MNLTFLPLSWTISREIPAGYRIEKLPFSKSGWVYYANFNDVPKTEQLLPNLSQNYFIRGIDKSQLGYFENCQKFFIGREAVLKLNSDHFSKKSLKEIIRRGKRHGNTSELPYSPQSISLLEEIKHSWSHSKEPQLRYLFADYFGKNERCFIFRNDINIWGAVVTSVNGPDKIHTELLLRREDAPVGIMEALLFDIYTILSRENEVKYLSLGEVPFIYGDYKPGLKNSMIIKLGRSLKFIYNYQGLYQFKNKFQPEWRDLFLVESNKIKIITLLGVVIKSNLLKLTLFKLKQLFKK